MVSNDEDKEEAIRTYMKYIVTTEEFKKEYEKVLKEFLDKEFL